MKLKFGYHHVGSNKKLHVCNLDTRQRSMTLSSSLMSGQELLLLLATVSFFDYCEVLNRPPNENPAWVRVWQRRDDDGVVVFIENTGPLFL